MEQTKSYKKKICGTASEEMWPDGRHRKNGVFELEKEIWPRVVITRGKSRARPGHTCGLGQREIEDIGQSLGVHIEARARTNRRKRRTRVGHARKRGPRVELGA